MRRRFLRKREERKLKKDQLKYENGLTQINDFFHYILSFANEYKQSSTKTLDTLGVFLKNITQDKANFVEDYEWLNTTAVTISANELRSLSYEIGNVTQKIGMSDENMKKIREGIREAFKKTQDSR